MSTPNPYMRQAMRRFSQLPMRSCNEVSHSRTTTQASQTLFSRSTKSSRTIPHAQQYLHKRPFSSSSTRFKTVQQAKTANRVGPFSMKSAGLFVATGIAMIFYFQYEKARLDRKRIVEMSKGYGKPKVGGPFNLRDLEGNEFTEKDLLGKYTLIYFGFSHCPDICPDELDKMSLAIDIVQKQQPNCLRSVFVTCDPARDTPAVLRSYLAEFHPSLLGLTGTWEETKNICKQYRVYFSTPPELKPGEEDYLVDHSIYFYVMDPEGDFVECIGRQDTPESAAGIVLQHIKDWKKEKKTIDTTPLPYLNVKPPAAAMGASTAGAAMPT